MFLSEYKTVFWIEFNILVIFYETNLEKLVIRTQLVKLIVIVLVVSITNAAVLIVVGREYVG